MTPNDLHAYQLLVADIEDVFTDADHDALDVYDTIRFFFAHLDTVSLLDDVFGSPDAEASYAAYEVFVGEWDDEGGAL